MVSAKEAYELSKKEAKKQIEDLIYAAISNGKTNCTFVDLLTDETISELKNLGYTVKWRMSPFEHWFVSWKKNNKEG